MMQDGLIRVLLAFVNDCNETTAAPVTVEDLPIPDHEPHHCMVISEGSFWAQLALGVMWCNVALCLHCIASVRHQVSNEHVLKQIVPVVHVVVPGFQLGEAACALHNELFNDDGALGCWAGESIQDCLDPTDPPSAQAPEFCGWGKGAKAFACHFGVIPC